MLNNLIPLAAYCNVCENTHSQTKLNRLHQNNGTTVRTLKNKVVKETMIKFDETTCSSRCDYVVAEHGCLRK